MMTTATAKMTALITPITTRGMGERLTVWTNAMSSPEQTMRTIARYPCRMSARRVRKGFANTSERKNRTSMMRKTIAYPSPSAWPNAITMAFTISVSRMSPA